MTTTCLVIFKFAYTIMSQLRVKNIHSTQQNVNVLLSSSEVEVTAGQKLR